MRRIPILVGGATATLLGLAAAPATASLAATGAVTAIASPASQGAAEAASSIYSILRTGDAVTGVRGSSNGRVVLTGGAQTGNGTEAVPFLYRGRPTRAATGAAVTVLTPPFPGVTTAMFYGPDTHTFNPSAIPSGQVRAVGSYESSSAPSGVRNQGMIYLGAVSGVGGSWTSIDVPGYGTHTFGRVRACPRGRADCYVMDTIPHSTMGDLAVGNYDLNPTRGHPVSGNAFIYNLIQHRWTLLQMSGSLSTQTTLYGIWQDGGSNSDNYTLAGGSSASGSQMGLLMSYNDRTGKVGRPRYYSYRNASARYTHFEGITAVRGGFNIVAESSAQSSSLAFIPFNARTGTYGTASWYPANVAASPLCASGCSFISGDTVYQNSVMGLYITTGSTKANTYLAPVHGR
jgi:hypothetical protein